jgi:hypothetical protein
MRHGIPPSPKAAILQSAVCEQSEYAGLAGSTSWHLSSSIGSEVVRAKGPAHPVESQEPEVRASEREEMSRRRRGRGEGSIVQRADGRWMGRVDLGWRNGKQQQSDLRSYSSRRR